MRLSFHIHRWIEYLAAVKDNRVTGGKYCKGHYRKCEKCGKWQEYVSNMGGGGWEDCQKPQWKLILYKDWESF